MWERAATLAALFLGLAISAHTIYAIIESRLVHERQKYALVRNLQLEVEYLTTLAGSLSNRAEQVIDAYAPRVAGEGFPPPATEQDTLPPEAAKEVGWLVKRAQHLIAFDVPIDVDRLGNFLNRTEIEAIIGLAQAIRTYKQVLETRTIDLEIFPRRKGVLHRFAGVAKLNIGMISDTLGQAQKTLGIGPTPSEQ